MSAEFVTDGIFSSRDVTVSVFKCWVCCHRRRRKKKKMHAPIANKQNSVPTILPPMTADDEDFEVNSEGLPVPELHPDEE